MSQAINDRIEEIFIGALACAGDDRTAFLEAACGDDLAMRDCVLELIETHENADGMLEVDEPQTRDEMIGCRVGQFTIERLLASGGMGNVYVATQDEPHREVALKLMRSGIASRSALRRFRFESQVLGRLHHPNIAQVFEAGSHDDGSGGVPYFAMEYLPDTTPITVFVESKKLRTRQRLSLFAKVCEAVHHGHQRGIIHRDLKPSNILVDSSGEPKIIDFGVARATDSDLAVTTLHTEIGQLIGTLQYMSPEQCEGDPDDLDTRSDVYALGVVLYEVLCGRLPYDVTRVSFAEAARVIREEAPSKPSVVNRTLRGDVETIALKALEKDRDRRYQSAADLAQDLGRYLRGEAIEARPPSAVYRARTFARRNKALVGGLVAVLVALTAGIVATSFALVRALTAEEDARGLLTRAEEAETESTQRASDLEQVVDFQQAQLADLDPLVMGTGLRNSILAKRREKLELQGVDDVEVQRNLDAFELALEGVNFTNVSNESLYENFFKPALQAIDARFGEQPLVQAQLLQSVASTVRELTMPEKAEAPQERALEIRRRKLGDAHPDTLASCIQMVMLHRSFGRYDEAEQLARLTEQTARRELGMEHWVTLKAINQLGVLLHTRGEHAESERLFREIGAKHNLAIVLFAQGKVDEPIRLWRELLDSDPNRVETNLRLGGALRGLGKLEEAEPYLRKGLEGLQHRWGEEHLKTLEAKNQMIILLREMYQRDGDVSKLQEAAEIGAKAVQDARRVWAFERPGVEWLLANHARVLTALGQFEQAEALLLEAEARLADTSVTLKNDGALAYCTRAVAEACVKLYDAWHAAEPDEGHDAQATEWRARLEKARAAAARFEPPFEPPADNDD